MISKKKLAGLGLALAFAGAGVTAANAAAGGTVTQTSTVSVDASVEAPLDTNIVANSQFTKLKISASGQTTFDDGVTNPGPDGAYPCSWDDCVLKDAPTGALLAKIDGGAWTVVGSGPTALTWDGKMGRHLYLAYNDRAGSYVDNSGIYTVTVERTK